jgi:hypothetical protein
MGLDFISNFSCNDVFCLKEIVIPYLAELLELSDGEKKLIDLLQIIFQTSNDKRALIIRILDSKIYYN